MPSSSRRHQKDSPTVLEARDWAALPRDILVDVFLRLGPCHEIMLGAERACTAWRRVAVGEPVLWRCIEMTSTTVLDVSLNHRQEMASAAVDRSSGQCEAFAGPVDEDFLIYLVERAPLLKSLQLSNSDVGDEILIMALKKLTLLEDLGISTPRYTILEDNVVFPSPYICDNLFESVCEACPHLKTFRVTTQRRFLPIYDISTMCKLRALELFNFHFKGLEAILDSCPVLESLHVTGYCSFDMKEMDEELQVKCARVKNVTLPAKEDEEDDSYYWENWDVELSSDDEFY